ncbi:hypothetical protein DPMN_058289 [Dreissena polymorpha]|uniref:Uncharacterized protein n=1 Tax=Dreissena polymorpha TaxID=45954 RepID=A0A9D4HF97_DREPO|nr:hypothetical protein DPMN_058289 [Dreissena polymorpha]
MNGIIGEIREKAPPPSPGGHVSLPIRTIFELNCCIKEANIGKNNVSYRLFTCFHYIHIEKTAPPPGGHVFQMFTTIFKLVRDIHITDANIVTSREKVPPPWTPCFILPIRTIFELNRRIQETYVLTKFHDDWTKNVTSTVENCPAPGGHVFSPIWTIFKLIRDINETNLLTKFHDDWAKIVTSIVFTRNTAPPPGGHVFQRTGTILKLKQHIIKTNILTKLHEDWSSNVTSTVFEPSRAIIRTNVLTKFHEDRTNNVASRVFTRQNVDDGRTTDARRTTDDGQKAIPKAHHEHGFTLHPPGALAAP